MKAVFTFVWGLLRSLWPKVRASVEALTKDVVGGWFDWAIGDPVALAARFPGSAQPQLVAWVTANRPMAAQLLQAAKGEVLAELDKIDPTG